MIEKTINIVRQNRFFSLFPAIHFFYEYWDVDFKYVNYFFVVVVQGWHDSQKVFIYFFDKYIDAHFVVLIFWKTVYSSCKCIALLLLQEKIKIITEKKNYPSYFV